ncbi:glycoside hydrolase family 3 protein [Skermania sp. ID1734]|uniref:glycoside hydrolase family 3 N-terminal domain-containing protein n=1 Tax=Skermania sp. ID1734 TaxID=2597516 RepID=UPI00117D5FA8|nr:glycoside hydrolase family 3 N-terminal domain-containing protein [Skermania sp. ID1734]TSD99335.1 glycoside hydrolase family 3 protein [Skermania sp. ID1734]
MRKPSALLVLLSVAVVAGCSSTTDRSDERTSAAAPAPVSNSTALHTTPAAESCEDHYLNALQPRDKLAQLLTVGVTGTDDAVNVVSKYHVGGIFIGGWTDQSLVTAGGLEKVNAAFNIPPMVTIDEEGGRVERLGNVIGALPAARTAAATMSPEQYYNVALQHGQAMRKLGITVNFAPDVDVSDEPANAVIGDRSFSDDPAKVTTYATQFIRAMHDAGVQPVIKHFPGHGHGSGDSHKGPVQTPPLAQLMTDDLVPFRNLVGSGAGVMVGHLDVPGLTSPGVPASISPAAMALLRNGVGYGAAPFNGPIFTDDLGGMAAITDRMGIVSAVETALEAGADVALWITTNAVPAVLDNLVAAMSSGKLNPQQVNQSVLRVARFKGTLHC